MFTKDLVRVDITQGDVVLPRGVETVGGTQGEWVDIIIPRYRLQELSNLQLPYTVLIADMDSYDREMMGSYHTFAQIQSILQDIATNYPSITSLYSIGTSYEGRTIWCLEITDNPGVDEGEPGVLFMGLHHAREWPTVEINLHIANNLTSLYGIDSTITDLVNNRRTWIVPCVNPDGYYYCHDLGNDWRKNRQYFPQYGSYGVDLNRNYNGSSNGDIWGAWGSIGSGSVTHDPYGETYCGPGPTSELEIQAISNFFAENDICASISWHTYQEELYWPWGYTASHTPDDSYISSVGTQIAQRITRQSGSGTYTPKQAYGLYPTVGDNIDWEYGYSHYVLGRATFAYTIEACAEFHPSASYLNQICKENCDGGLYLLSEAENIRDTIVPRVLPPILDELPNDADGNYRVSWQEQNPSANPDYFQLDELNGLSIGTDNAESGSGLWTLDGFALSTSRYHSGSSSFKSRHSDADVSSMTTVYPIPVTTGMTLSFWCWYATENNYDDAFVEVSKDGRSYDILDIFTGSSGGWIYKEYDLSNYSNESLFIRFRYTTDQGTLLEGFYVDDITPVADVQTVTTLSSSITNHFYDITGKSNGTYYYQVKGHNSARGWGDFSTLERVIVSLGDDLTPPVTTCTLAGDMEGGVYVSDVTVTLTATDDSGVDYTKYKLDNGIWTTYTVPFVVSTNGNHTVLFYSVDNAGNTETEKSSTFTIQQEVPPVTITIKGGLGVSATIKNTGITTLTNLSWTITLDGKNIFFGKTKTDMIVTLAAGESITIKDFVLGIGKTGIAVNVGAAQASATGTVILIFVIGVK
ncbi:MAG: immune inhibitor A [Thermoplasmata archaeon]|nr:immune inhibitor A [Thermoplasmata archaeon]